MNLSIKNRIAVYSVLGIATVSLVVFIAIFFSVRNHSKGQIDEKLKFEAEKHLHEINITEDSVYFVYKDEWLEREHLEIEVFPVFVELVDDKGNSIDKSPNLLNSDLSIKPSIKDDFIINYELNEITVRQIQMPIKFSNKIIGFLAIATSFEDTQLVLDALIEMLLTIYPILLLVTFFTSRFISNITIKPITIIANQVSEIDGGHLNRRVKFRDNGDELEILSTAINNLLDRIDDTLSREKQFTADASHQLRTPLAVMKGNLQVLLRKKRSEEEYQEEIQKAILRIDDMTDAVEKLLILARLNTTHRKLNFENINLYPFIEQVFKNYKKSIIAKGLSLKIDDQLKDKIVFTKRRFLDLILDNLISNAIKYSYNDSTLKIQVKQSKRELTLIVENQGPVISPQDLNDIFIPFFRNKTQTNTEKGFGLGLAIVKKASEALDLEISVFSENETTRFSLIFQT